MIHWRILKLAAMAAVGVAISLPAMAAGEVNVYSYRQPELIKPLFDAFTNQTGVKVNMVYAQAGLLERLKAEGANSPADMVLSSDMSRLLETIAFARVESRLAATLLARADAQGRVAATHQGLAEEVGTAREVVSRQLEAFSRAGLVRLSRGEVKVIDRTALEARASVT